VVGGGDRHQLEKGPLAVCYAKQLPVKLYLGVVMRKTALGALAVLFLCGLPGVGADGMKWSLVNKEPLDAPLQIEGAFMVIPGGYLQGIELTIANHGMETVVLLWDECSLVLPNRESLKIIHTGVRYIEKGKPQAPTPIPPKAFIREAVWPADYVQWVGSRWVERGIKIGTGDKISVHLAWQDSKGTHYGIWTWEIPPLPEKQEKHGRMWLSLSGILNLWLPDVPTVIPWLVLSWTNYNEGGELTGYNGINLGLGVSFRTFLTKATQANLYWGWGTVVLVLPYIEFGVTYQTDWVVIDVGTWWIYPRVGFAIKF